MKKKQPWAIARMQYLIDCSFNEQPPTIAGRIAAWLVWAVNIKTKHGYLFVQLIGHKWRIWSKYLSKRDSKKELAAKRELYVIHTPAYERSTVTHPAKVR